MHRFRFIKDELWCEEIPVRDVADDVGTPLYLYSQRTVQDNFARITNAFKGIDHLICFAVKANSNPEILSLLADEGAGADVVSGGELYLALKGGMEPGEIVFAGVGKRDDEIKYALEKEILSFNVESIQELRVINQIAESSGKTARVGLRLNPNIDIQGHPYISTGKAADKFGIDLETARRIFATIGEYPNVNLVGLHVHVGSQVKTEKPYIEVVQLLKSILVELRASGNEPGYVDIGGGLGVDYENVVVGNSHDETAVEANLDGWIETIRADLLDFGCKVIFEPGRALVAEAGILVTRVLYRKVSQGKSFLVVDAGMNDLIRPSLYQAYHVILPVKATNAGSVPTDVVGPICESGDFFAHDRMLPKLERGDLAAIMTAGAYGFTLASNYNARPKPAEVLIDGANYRIIRPRQKIEEL